MNNLFRIIGFLILVIANQSTLADIVWVDAYMTPDKPITGSSVTLETISGAPLLLTQPVATNPDGIALVETLNPLPAKFLVIVHVNETVPNSNPPVFYEDIRLSAIVSKNDLSDTVFVGPVSTILADFAKAHPNLPIKTSQKILNRALRIPNDADPMKSAWASRDWFDGDKALAASGSERLDDYLQGLSKSLTRADLTYLETPGDNSIFDEILAQGDQQVSGAALPDLSGRESPKIAPILLKIASIFTRVSTTMSTAWGKVPGPVQGLLKAGGKAGVGELANMILGITDTNELAQQTLDQSKANARAIAENGRKLDVLLKAQEGVSKQLSSIKDLINTTNYNAATGKAVEGWSNNAEVYVYRQRNIALLSTYCDGAGPLDPPPTNCDIGTLSCQCTKGNPLALPVSCIPSVVAVNPNIRLRCDAIKSRQAELENEILTDKKISEVELANFALKIGLNGDVPSIGAKRSGDGTTSTVLGSGTLLYRGNSSPYLGRQTQDRMISLFNSWALSRFDNYYKVLNLKLSKTMPPGYSMSDTGQAAATRDALINDKLSNLASGCDEATMSMYQYATLNRPLLPVGTAMRIDGPAKDLIWWVNQRLDNEKWVGTLTYSAVFSDSTYYSNNMLADGSVFFPAYTGTPPGMTAAQAHATRTYWARHDWFKWGTNEFSSCGIACSRLGNDATLKWRFPTVSELEQFAPLPVAKPYGSDPTLTALATRAGFMIFDAANHAKGDQDPLYVNQYPTQNKSHLWPVIWLNDFDEAWAGHNYIVRVNTYDPSWGRGKGALCAGPTVYYRTDLESGLANEFLTDKTDSRIAYACGNNSNAGRISTGNNVLGIVMQVAPAPVNADNTRAKYVLEP